jgi:hypothetical protein
VESDQTPEPLSDEETISETVDLLRAIDNTPLGDMNALFYQHFFEELNMAVRSLLEILGRAPES